MENQAIIMSVKHDEVNMLSFVDKFFDFTVKKKDWLDAIPTDEIKEILRNKNEFIVPTANFNDDRHILKSLQDMFDTPRTITKQELAKVITEYLTNSTH